MNIPQINKFETFIRLSKTNSFHRFFLAVLTETFLWFSESSIAVCSTCIISTSIKFHFALEYF